MHGFGSATAVNDVAQGNGSKPLTLTSATMTRVGCTCRSATCGSATCRIGLTAMAASASRSNGSPCLRKDCDALGRKPAFNVAEKVKDPRAPWFCKNYGRLCRELDAMDPNDLRARVHDVINQHIEPKAWERCRIIDEAERESMSDFLSTWKAPKACTRPRVKEGE
jgi:hypothetical protein